jgi:putative spermidine/putrescine transport system ATP-binding protein
VAVMHQGRIEQFAAPDEVYGRPATAFVATFVGESTFVPGRAVRTIGEELEFTTEAGDILRGRPASTFPVGAAVMGVIRPERLIAVPEPKGSPEAGFLNLLTTTCREIMYIGDQTRYEVETATRLRMVLRLQNHPGIPRFTIGDRLQVRWQSEDLRVFAADSFTGLLPGGPLVLDAP